MYIQPYRTGHSEAKGAHAYQQDLMLLSDTVQAPGSSKAGCYEVTMRQCVMPLHDWLAPMHTQVHPQALSWGMGGPRPT